MLTVVLIFEKKLRITLLICQIFAKVFFVYIILQFLEINKLFMKYENW